MSVESTRVLPIEVNLLCFILLRVTVCDGTTSYLNMSEFCSDWFQLSIWQEFDITSYFHHVTIDKKWLTSLVFGAVFPIKANLSLYAYQRVENKDPTKQIYRTFAIFS